MLRKIPIELREYEAWKNNLKTSKQQTCYGRRAEDRMCEENTSECQVKQPVSESPLCGYGLCAQDFTLYSTVLIKVWI